MLADSPLSRAGSLPQWICVVHQFYARHYFHVGAWLAREDGITFNIAGDRQIAFL
jgi:hypothetical protein